MKSEDEVLEDFNERLGLYLESSAVQQWRSEVSVLYGALAGKQWDQRDVTERQLKNKPIDTINRIQPIINAIAGYEVINRTDITVTPRKDTPTESEETESDVMTDAIQYLQDESDFYFESSLASKDMITCGIGATHTYFDYTNPDKPYGEVLVDRIFPGFLLYDNTCSRRNFKGAMWAGYVEIVNRQWLTNEIEAIKGEEEGGSFQRYELATRTTRGVNDFLFFVDNVTTDDIDILYHYEWCEYERVRIFRNFIIETLDQPQLLEMAADFEEVQGLDMADPYLTMNDKQYRAFRTMLKEYHEQGGFDYRELIDPTIGQRRKYYKARIARGTVLDMSESWATDFTIQYKTGYYDELDRIFYGLGRSLLEPCRLLNKAISDYDSYLESVPKGGMYVEVDAVEDAIAFKETRANEQNLTLLKKGGLGKIQPKEVPQVPGGLADYIGLMNQLIPASIGLPQDFLGQVESGNMTNSLFSKIVRQAYMVLVQFFEANKVYMRREGRVFIDAVRILSDNYDGLVLEKVTNKGEEFTLSKESLSRAYTLKIVERPHSEDELVDRFERTIQAANVLRSGPNPIDIAPLIVESWPYELEDKKAIKQIIQQQMEAQQAAMQPPPPDPLAQALIEAETAEKIATAKLNEARAMKQLADIQQGRVGAQADVIKAQTDQRKQLADIQERNKKLDIESAKVQQSMLETRLNARFRRAELKLKEAELAIKARQASIKQEPTTQIIQNLDEPINRLSRDLTAVIEAQQQMASIQIGEALSQIGQGNREALESFMQNNEGLRDAIVNAIAGVAEGNSQAMNQLQQTLATGTQLTAEQQQRLEQGVAELAQKMNQAANQKKKVRIIYDEEGDPIGAEQVEEDEE